MLTQEVSEMCQECRTLKDADVDDQHDDEDDHAFCCWQWSWCFTRKAIAAILAAVKVIRTFMVFVLKRLKTFTSKYC